MSSISTKHVSWGAMAALRHSNADLSKYPEVAAHFGECSSCKENYDYFRTHPADDDAGGYKQLVRSIREQGCSSERRLFDTNAAYFNAFLSKSLPDEYAIDLLGHLNTCYPCLESFVRNLNEYLSLKKG